MINPKKEPTKRKNSTRLFICRKITDGETLAIDKNLKAQVISKIKWKN